MVVISYGEPLGQYPDNYEMMGRRKCNDCYCDEDDCPRDCFDCGRYGYCEDDCGCDDGADCFYDD